MVIRILLAVLVGGLLGLERERRSSPAGFRTYMLVAIGSTMTVMLSQYLDLMLATQWRAAAQAVGATHDVSRFGAQVINGVGFLGAGSIILTGRKRVKGLTTAAGLWASACLGLAIGAGYYECVLVSVALILVCMYAFPALENRLILRSRYMNILAELDGLENLGLVLGTLREQGVTVFDIDLSKQPEDHRAQLGVHLSVYLPKNLNHTQLLAKLAALGGMVSIEESQYGGAAMLSCFDFIREPTTLAMALRLLLAFICGGVIGAEREIKRRPAGFRTHILICLGAAITTLTSQYLLLGLGLFTDIGRLGAQVIAGIGFIGAGTIIVTGRRQVKGLTTAAGLWASAIVGLACGAGFVECALFATVVILFAEIVLIKFEFKFAKSGRLCTLYIEYTKPDTIQNVLEMMSERSLKVSNLEVSRTQGEDEEHRYYALLSVQTTPKIGGTELVPAITALPNVFAVEEM